MSISEWSNKESKLILSTAGAPLVVAAAVSAVGVVRFGPDARFIAVALVPAAYATLFLFVLPTLWLLRRIGKESLLSFSAACALSVIIPWFFLYMVFFSAYGSGTTKYSGAPLQVLLILSVPAMFSAVTAAAIYKLFGNQPVKNGA
jgi:hypothetical protein